MGSYEITRIELQSVPIMRAAGPSDPCGLGSGIKPLCYRLNAVAPFVEAFPMRLSLTVTSQIPAALQASKNFIGSPVRSESIEFMGLINRTNGTIRSCGTQTTPEISCAQMGWVWNDTAVNPTSPDGTGVCEPSSTTAQLNCTAMGGRWIAADGICAPSATDFRKACLQTGGVWAGPIGNERCKPNPWVARGMCAMLGGVWSKKDYVIWAGAPGGVGTDRLQSEWWCRMAPKTIYNNSLLVNGYSVWNKGTLTEIPDFSER